MNPSTAAKRATLRTLHASGCFVIPNPWDVGSARYLQHLGFKALATTSAGMAFSMGLPDNGVSREAALGHIRSIVEAAGVPVNADFESGFAADPAGVAESVTLCVKTGVAGLSIEDSKGDGLYERSLALERFKAARAAAKGVVLTARAGCFLVGHPDPLRESLKRLEAYAAAGADCL